MGDHLPDECTAQSLKVMRANARDDCPVAAIWNPLLVRIVLQRVSIESLLEVCDFDCLPVAVQAGDADRRRGPLGVVSIEHAAAEEALRVVAVKS